MLNLLSGLSLLLMLCLGSQNLNNRQVLKAGNLRSAPLPSGFVIGVSIIAGVISGGSTAAILSSPPRS